MLENDEIVSVVPMAKLSPQLKQIQQKSRVLSSHLHGNIVGFAIVRVDLNWPRLVDILSKGDES